MKINVFHGGIMKTVLLAMFLTAFTDAAFALNLVDDPKFPYAGAKQAYESARVPRLEELTGKWMLTGFVREKSSSDAGYWPDGKYKVDGQPGYFMQIIEISSTMDIFGNEMLSSKESVVGVETGKVYEERLPIPGYVAKAEAVFNYNMSNSCPAILECRMVDKLAVLLCRHSSLEKKSNCSAKHAWAYTVFNKVPPKPSFQ